MRRQVPPGRSHIAAHAGGQPLDLADGLEVVLYFQNGGFDFGFLFSDLFLVEREVDVVDELADVCDGVAEGAQAVDVEEGGCLRDGVVVVAVVWIDVGDDELLLVVVAQGVPRGAGQERKVADAEVEEIVSFC